MTRELCDGIYWVQECSSTRFIEDPTEGDLAWYDPRKRTHTPQNAYLLVGAETLLFDTLSRAGTTQILSALTSVLGDRPLDYLVVSHPETPHAGNTFPILDRYPNCELVAADRRSAHDLYYLGDALKVTPGDEIELGGLTVRFEEPTFLDHSVHLWMSELTHDVLFTVDWLGFPHLEDECSLCVDELETPITEGRLRRFHERVFFWFKYADLPKVESEIDHLIEGRNPSILAPAHGLPVRKEVAAHMEMMKPVTRSIRTDSRDGWQAGVE